MKQEDIIDHVHVVLHTDNATASYLQACCSQLFSAQLKSAFENILKDNGRADEFLQFDSLTIDVGDIPLANFEREFCARVLAQFDKLIRATRFNPEHEYEYSAADGTEYAYSGRQVLSTRRPGISPDVIPARAHDLTQKTSQASRQAGDLSRPDNAGPEGFSTRNRVGETRSQDAGFSLAGNAGETKAPPGLPQPESMFNMFLHYLTHGRFDAPDVWTGAGKPDRWVLAVVSLLPEAKAIPLTQTQQYAFALVCLQQQARTRLSRTFSIATLAALTRWLENRLDVQDRPYGQPLSSLSGLAETALYCVLQAHAVQSAAFAESRAAIRTKKPAFADIDLPASSAEIKRWEAIVASMPNVSQDVRNVFSACLKAASPSPPISASASDNVTQPSTSAPGSGTSNTAAPTSRRVAASKQNVPDMLFRVPDAGVCLLWPLLPTLFAQLNLTYENQFYSVESRNKAVCFLDHLIWCDGQAAEWRTTFSRWLCGWNDEDPFEWYFPEEPQAQLIAQFLSQFTSMVVGWERCEPEDIQAFFLQRPGNLTYVGHRWHLQPDAGAQDILLQNIPWPVHELRMPWREDILFVQWL